jgi:hypothetical protein
LPCPKSIILKTTDLEQVIEKAENIYNFYLDSNWEIPIYIKIYITKVNGAPNYCISFHIAKFEMTFPYKTTL